MNQGSHRSVFLQLYTWIQHLVEISLPLGAVERELRARASVAASPHVSPETAHQRQAAAGPAWRIESSRTAAAVPRAAVAPGGEARVAGEPVGALVMVAEGRPAAWRPLLILAAVSCFEAAAADVASTMLSVALTLTPSASRRRVEVATYDMATRV